VLGILLALIVIAPVFGVGAYLFRRGARTRRRWQVQKEVILNAVLTRQVTINDLSPKCRCREDIERMIQDLCRQTAV
jgi:hypothetical protein